MEKNYTKLKELREKQKYSYSVMAQKLGISQCFYWQIENKQRRLYYDMAKRIAAIFSVKPDDIFFE